MAILMFVNEAPFSGIFSSKDEAPSRHSMAILVFINEALFLGLFSSEDEVPPRHSMVILVFINETLDLSNLCLRSILLSLWMDLELDLGLVLSLTSDWEELQHYCSGLDLAQVWEKKVGAVIGSQRKSHLGS
ncbi:hypothetical protein COCNU_scaffold000267G000010 [Cocos nucifera]|nr:hypothetical protein [Cocos nucifera]